MNRFTPFIDQPGRRTVFYDGLIFGALLASLVFAGGFTLVLFAIAR